MTLYGRVEISESFGLGRRKLLKLVGCRIRHGCS